MENEARSTTATGRSGVIYRGMDEWRTKDHAISQGHCHQCLLPRLDLSVPFCVTLILGVRRYPSLSSLAAVYHVVLETEVRGVANWIRVKQKHGALISRGQCVEPFSLLVHCCLRRGVGDGARGVDVDGFVCTFVVAYPTDCVLGFVVLPDETYFHHFSHS